MTVQPIRSFVDGSGQGYLELSNGHRIALPSAKGEAAGGGVAGEVVIGATAPTDGTDLWVNTADGKLYYRHPDTGVYTPITGSSEPTNMVAGAGLSESPADTFNVGAGSGITVAADSVAVNYTTLDTVYSRLPTSSGVTITDWNQAINNGTTYMASGAANAPDTGWFMGFCISHNGVWHIQLVTAFANSRWPSGALFIRECENGVWGDWNRHNTYIWSRDTIDGFSYSQHNGTGSNMGIRRFAWGMYKDKGTNAPSANDAFRVQCYDTAGAYSWSAMVALESGVVTFPKGHSLLATALNEEQPVPSDAAMTVGMAVNLVARALELAGVPINPAALARLVESEYDEEQGPAI